MGDPAAPPPHGEGEQSGIRLHPEFASRFLPHARTLGVWLPPGYPSAPHLCYPVLYLHDGQNLFDPSTAFGGVPWGVDRVAEREVRADRVEPLIIVGVANTPDRLDEYGPKQHHRKGRDRARDYGRFLVEKVKPFIDATYRTLRGPEDTGVGGSSMGGLISLHLCQWFPDVFGKCAAMSPSLWWDNEYFLRTAAASAEWTARCRVWLDVGERETDTEKGSEETLRRARRLAEVLTDNGMREGEQFRYLEVPGGTHHESAWGARFDQVLRFLFGPASGRV